ncbi:winged helix-turn-helix transcriptional regulator [Bacillus sp. AKBS9]|uniref:winged helix-turn-helix transcriptional regulator n=1 Tax=Bacillus sp. AKBS9 TaxID=2072506 RepID=UPI000CCC389E|nr:winged helix-turn-helix transcriptional regulator [Bacillus sp. AKBS9]PNS29713.1 hypothetical protein C1640_24930 [Bacillus sp. AKBS9]
MNDINPVELTKGLPGIPCPIAKTLDVIRTKWTFLPRVEYTLTDKGKQLEGIFIELKRFGLSL